MSKNISKFIGIDIDDKAYHVSVYQASENTFINFKTGSSPELLLKALKKYKITPGDKICYEASYIGYSLYRALTKAGYFCQIIAPSLIPRQPGMKQKTDKIDAKKLSEYYFSLKVKCGIYYWTYC